MPGASIKSDTCKKHGLYFFYPELTRQLLNLYCKDCRQLVRCYIENVACVCCGKTLTQGADDRHAW